MAGALPATSCTSFSQYRRGKAVEGLGREDKGSRPADHVAAEIILEPRLLGQDRQPVDHDAGRRHAVARRRRGHAEIGHPVAGDVDHPPRRGFRQAIELRGGGEQCRTDGGGPAGTAGRGAQRRGEGACAPGVGEQPPIDGDRDLVGVRPFEDERLDPAGSGADRVDQTGIRKGAGDAIVLEHIGIGGDAGGYVDSQDDGEGRRLSRERGETEGAAHERRKKARDRSKIPSLLACAALPG